MSRIATAIRLDDDARARGWLRALPALGVALAALMVPMWDPARRLYELWMTNNSYGHGVLIVPIMLYLFWLKRREFLRLTPAPSLVGVAAIAALMILWFAARMLGIMMLEQLVLVASLVAVAWAVLGFKVASRAAPIIVYLMCAVPVWSYLTPILQTHTAIASAAMVRALGVPVFLDGLYISIPDGRFVVADVCSGMRYLLAALSLGGFYALLNLYTWQGRIALVTVSFVLGIAFNWLRVVGIVYVGHQSQMQSSLVRDHDTYGWLLFLIVVAGILALGRVLERLEAGRARSGAPDFQPAPRAVRSTSAFIAAAMVAGVVSIAPAVLASAWLRAPEDTLTLEVEYLARAGGWQRVPERESQWQPQFGNMDAAALASFDKPGQGQPVDVFVAYYATQRQDAEAVNDTNKNFDSSVWRRYSMRAVPERVELGRGVAEEYMIQHMDRRIRRVVWRTNWINDRLVTGTLEAKVQQLLGSLRGRRAAAALVFSTPVGGSEEQARARLREFTTANLDLLLEQLRTMSPDH